MLGDLLGGLRNRLEHGPDRAGRDTVDPYFPVDEISRQRLRERVNGALGGGVVEKRRASFQPGDRPGVDDYSPRLQMPESGFRHEKISIDVRAERGVPLVLGNLFQTRSRLLIRSIVDQDVEMPERLDDLIDGLITEMGVADVTRNEKAFLVLSLYRPLRLFSIRLLCGQINDGDVCPFSCEKHGDGAARCPSLLP